MLRIFPDMADGRVKQPICDVAEYAIFHLFPFFQYCFADVRNFPLPLVFKSLRNLVNLRPYHM